MDPLHKITTVEEMLERGKFYNIPEQEQPIPFGCATDADFPILVVPEDGQPLNPEEEMLVERIQRFFTRNMVRDRVMPVVLDKEPCSLRDLFWLVTNYYQVHETRYMVPHEDYPITLFDDYEAWMDHYGKNNYDTYQRGGRHFNVLCREDESFCFRETISQMIWFEWAIRRLVVEYAAMHIEEIRAHQKKTNSENKERHQREGKQFKRQPLTQRPQRVTHMLPGQVPLSVRY